jgi:hypothetical protein
MTIATHAGTRELPSVGRRPEPRSMTLADLSVSVAAVALALTIPSTVFELPPYLSPQAALLFFVLIGGLQLTIGFGLVLGLVMLFRHGRYGGSVRPAEWLALGLASVTLLSAVPNLDGSVNAYYAAVGSSALDFGVARWLLAAPAAAGVVLVVAAFFLIRRREREASRFASALTVVGIVGGLFLWFWGPCEVARLELPWLLVPSPAGNPQSWGWRGPVVFALRELVANVLVGLSWGVPAAASARAWWGGRRGRAQGWVWTDRAAFVNAVAVALLMAIWGGMLSPIDVVRRAPFWIVSVGMISWWIAGLLLVERDLAAPA